MQGNNFDDSIRDLLNSNTPDFNPADWARMEEMLQHVPATDAPQADASAGIGSSAGSAVTGMKMWAAAALVSISAVTTELVYDSVSGSENITEQAAGTENKAISAENSIALQNNLAIDKADISENTASAKAVAGSASAVSASASTQNKAVARIVTSPELTANNKTGQPVSALSSSSLSGNNLQKAETGASGGNFSSIPPFSSGRSGNSGNDGGTSSFVSGGNSAVANHCQEKPLPTLPYIIAGLDTVTDLEFTLFPCEPFCLMLPAQSNSKGDKVRMSANLSGLEGAHFELSPEKATIGSFCWTPSSEQAREESYSFRINLQNETCPGVKTYTIRLKVAPQRIIRITGDSVLQAGQQGRIRVTGNTPEANYRWSNAAGLIGSAQTREILIAPEKAATYSVNVTTARGCALIATYKVKVDDATATSSIFVPNIITPNGDGYNDVFVVEGVEPGQMDLTVSSLGGKVLYRQIGYRNSWDGNGLENGWYIYTLRFNKTGEVKNGRVEIKR